MYFIVNLQLIWTEVIISGPHVTVTIGTCIRIAVAIKVRVIIVSRIVCNVDIVPPSKRWTVAIPGVCGINIVGVHVFFKVSISVVVSQRVNEGVGRVLPCRTP